MPTARTLISLTLAAGGLCASAGCSYSYDQNFFDYDREQSRARRVFEASYAKAAMNESALYPSHFDATDDGEFVLNGLGRERIDHMLSARKPGVMMQLRIDVGEKVDATVTDRMADAAEAYLDAAGLKPELYAIAVGEAPVQTQARGSLAALNDAESSKDGNDGGDSVASLGGLFGKK